MGINATAAMIRSSNYDTLGARTSFKITLNEGKQEKKNPSKRKAKRPSFLTFKANVRRDKSNAEDEVDEVLGCDYGLKVNLQGL